MTRNLAGTARRVVRFALTLSTLITPAAHAGGTVDLSWDRCTPVVLDKVIWAGTVQRLLVSVTGQDEPHEGYQFFITIRDVDGSVPDAWRFDAGGCQPAGNVSIEYVWADMPTDCRLFQGPLASTQTRGYQPVTLGVPGVPMVAYLTNSYPAGQYGSDPARRYALGMVIFDHGFSVPGEATEPETCGGVDRPMCFTLDPTLTGYRAIDGTLRPYQIGNGTVTSFGGCQPVPAVGSTWGAIKGQYRR